MRIVSFDTYGGPEVLRTEEVDDLEPGPGEVLLEVAAAGVNNADLLQRAGRYPPPPGAPTWPGLEVSGRVVAVGPGMDLTLDSAWCALLDGGGYAEHAVVPVERLLPVPRGVDLVDAAGLPEAACTVWSTLADAGLAPGEWLLVHGGSGGVGSHAVQVAAALGARVVTTAGGPERANRCRHLGADVVVDHRTEDFVAVVRDVTDGRGVDVILDVIGGGYLGRNVEALAVGGRLAVLGLQQGRRGELDLGAMLAKRATLLGRTLRARPAAEKAAIVRDVREHVWPWLDDGAVRPVVHDRIPLADARRAHERMAAGEVFGKLLLVP